MKLAGSVLLFCTLFVFIDARLVRTYGDVKNYPLIDRIQVFAAGDYNGRVQRKVVYPEESKSSQYIIHGMTHHDYEEYNPTATFATAEFQVADRIEFNLTSSFSYGMSSTFRFYGETVSN